MSTCVDYYIVHVDAVHYSSINIKLCSSKAYPCQRNSDMVPFSVINNLVSFYRPIVNFHSWTSILIYLHGEYSSFLGFSPGHYIDFCSCCFNPCFNGRSEERRVGKECGSRLLR